ncbi:MAG: efflux RND transporter periplasmic adaptor subunit [Dehalococcoidia bacterium]|nr:efflux RND transporter periplasmic adaptor subunit [Dehalococcoidia bacterium]
MRAACGLVAVILLGLLSSGCASLPITLPWDRGSTALSASGTLEADETLVATRVTSQVTALPVAEGDQVPAGAVVARLDDRAVQLQIRQAPDIASRLTYELQAQDYVLHSPVAGVVTRVPVNVGEMALPGQVLLAVADLSTLRLTLYVEEADLAHVRIGQRVTLVADPYPARTFEGVVTSINHQAEFTPRNVQTRTDRLNLVFGVHLTVENPDAALRPGMPVDATFDTVVVAGQ